MECPNCRRPTSALAERCVACGARMPPGQYLLEQSGILDPGIPGLPHSPTVPRNLPIASVTPRAGSRIAGLGDRFIATVLDMAVLSGAFAWLGMWAFLRWGVVVDAEFRVTAAALLIAVALSALVLFAYHWVLESVFGATPGKVIVGIRVVDNSRHPPWAASAIRNALRLVDGIGFYAVGTLAAGCSKARQRLGDRFAGTVVVEHGFSGAGQACALLLWFAALGAAGWYLPQSLRTSDAALHPPRYLSQTVMRFGRTPAALHVRAGGFRVEVKSDSDAAEHAPGDLQTGTECPDGGIPEAGTHAGLKQEVASED